MSREIGVVGLGRIGAAIGRRLQARGFRVLGFDRERGARAGAEASGLETVDSLSGLVANLVPPRTLWLALPAGEPVTSTLAELGERLVSGDLVIEGGNSDYRQSIEHAARLGRRGLRFVDVGTSGGVDGEGDGYGLMVGGEPEAVEAAREFFEALAPAPDRGWGRVGGPGSGHFAKMVHNAIEYGLMQAYAEGFAMLDARGDLGLQPRRVAEIWRHGSIVRSWLLDLVAETLDDDPRAIERVAPWVADSGEGRWAVREAVDLGLPIPVITTSLLQRFASRDERRFAERLLAALRGRFGGHAVRRERDRR